MSVARCFFLKKKVPNGKNGIQFNMYREYSSLVDSHTKTVNVDNQQNNKIFSVFFEQ